MKQLAILNPENVSEVDLPTYRTREAVRAVVLDDQDMVALLHVTEGQYYKLPGGGVEGEENQEMALLRECQEEIGSDIEVLQELGTIIEFRKISTFKQTSYCYLAKLKGKKGLPHFTQLELDRGFEIMWLPYKEALLKLSNNIATNFEVSTYIVPRDILFLKAANVFLNTL